MKIEIEKKTCMNQNILNCNMNLWPNYVKWFYLIKLIFYLTNDNRNRYIWILLNKIKKILFKVTCIINII
jgi:hypothetical protein